MTIASHPTPILSVLIASIPSRLRQLAELVASIDFQISGRTVEIIALTDNYHRTIGEKRNNLLDAARGRFVAFVDDDDMVTDDYVTTICDAIEAFPEADAIAFDAEKVGPAREGSPARRQLIQYGAEFTDRTPGAWPVPIQHVCPIRATIAKTVRFPHENKGEDAIWAAHVRQKIGSVVRIPKVLYRYRSNMMESSSRGRKAYTGAAELWNAVFQSGEDEQPEFAQSRADAVRMIGYQWPLKIMANFDDLPRILDVGAGRGQLGESFLPPGTTRINQLDVVRLGQQEIFPSIAADLATPDGRNVLRTVAPEGRWDFAACLHVLEHLPDHAIPKVLFSLAQVARRGVFAVSGNQWRWQGHNLRRTIMADWQWAQLIGERWEIVNHEYDRAANVSRFMGISRYRDGD